MKNLLMTSILLFVTQTSWAFCGRQFGQPWQGATKICASIIEEKASEIVVHPYAVFSLVSGAAAFSPLVRNNFLCRSLGLGHYISGSQVIKRGDVRLLSRVRAEQIMWGENVRYIYSLTCAKK